MTTLVNVVKCGTLEESKRQLAKVIQKSVDEHKGSVFKVGLSGGSLPSILSQVLPTIRTDWKKWKFMFCDERIVSFSDPESTFGAYKSLLVSKIPEISLSQFVTIDPSLKASDAAFDYLSKVKQVFKRKADPDLPRFDILFLGMGPDGHTCSLFPDHPVLKEKNLWVVPITDSPKPPPNRITLTLPVLNNAKLCIFYTTGAAKAQMLKEIIVEQRPLPAGLVKPTNGELYWILDNEAASLIPNDMLRRMSMK